MYNLNWACRQFPRCTLVLFSIAVWLFLYMSVTLFFACWLVLFSLFLIVHWFFFEFTIFQWMRVKTQKHKIPVGLNVVSHPICRECPRSVFLFCFVCLLLYYTHTYSIYFISFHRSSTKKRPPPTKKLEKRMKIFVAVRTERNKV